MQQAEICRLRNEGMWRWVGWTRSGRNQVARVFNHITWQPFAELAHPLTLTSPKTAVVYMEVTEPVPLTEAREARGRYSVCSLPQVIPNQKPPADKPNPRLGVGACFPCPALFPPTPYGERRAAASCRKLPSKTDMMIFSWHTP
jgi:hypothetical protein